MRLNRKGSKSRTANQTTFLRTARLLGGAFRGPGERAVRAHRVPVGPMASQAAGACPRHQQLRTLATQLGLKNSFLGSNQLTLEAVAAMRQQRFRTPAVVMTKASHLATQGAEYEELLQRVGLEQLAEAFPSHAWQHFVETGWAAMPMQLAELDKRFLQACMLCNLANLGVTPTRADTYLNAEGQAGYDFTNGWLRNPCTTPNASFVSTHPSVFRLTVGFLARRLLNAGTCGESVRALLTWKCIYEQCALLTWKRIGYCHALDTATRGKLPRVGYLPVLDVATRGTFGAHCSLGHAN